MLKWKPVFSVGDPAVDYEHRQLLELVNKAAQAILENKSEEVIDQLFGDLLHGISVHFAHEERLMRTSGYDQLDTHKKDHERLLDVLRDIMDCQRHAPQKSSKDLAKLLSDWFIGHFSTHDTRLHNKLGPHYQTNMKPS